MPYSALLLVCTKLHADGHRSPVSAGQPQHLILAHIAYRFRRRKVSVDGSYVNQVGIAKNASTGILGLSPTHLSS